MLAKVKKSNNYCDNDRLRELIIQYKKEVKDYQRKNKTDKKPKMNDELGTEIYNIAVRFAARPNFNGYTFKDDMISEGIQSVLKYLHNYDETISKNAFSYITQILFHSYVHVINQERKVQYIKLLAMENAGIYGYLQDVKRELFEKSSTNSEETAEDRKIDPNDILALDEEIFDMVLIEKNAKKKKMKKRKTSEYSLDV